jgi:hypothetical protein
LRARIAELRRELGKLSGVNSKPGEAETFNASSEDMPYPSIRNLPLLGVKYADFYRQAKIQETVYELLTEQYELAKVEEAKETPSVKVLDPARVPEWKSSPPRLVIILVGTLFALGWSVVWVLGSARWEEVDARDPRKVLAKEVAGALKARMPWTSRNGNAPDSRAQEIEDQLDSRRPPTNGPADR